jgi:NTE family protein
MVRRLPKALCAVLLLLLASLSGPAAAVEPSLLHFSLPESGPAGTAPAGTLRIGLALAGGGAKAAASIGVLNVLAEEGIPVAAIAGTSMGAIIGGFAAAGHRPDDIERIFLDNDWNDLFTDTPSRTFLTQAQREAGGRHLLQFGFIGGRFVPPPGLSAGQKLGNLLAAQTLAASFQAGFRFDQLPVPFRAVATDIETGSAVALDRGLLHDALRASAAVPVVFPPVEIGGRLLVDGGLSDNLPVSVVKGMGVDIVIAVDPSSRLERKESLTTLLGVMDQSVSIPVRRETERQAALADVVIAPDVSPFSFSDFDRMEDIIEAGANAARAALPGIRRIIAARGAAEAPDRFVISALTVTGAVGTQEDAVRSAGQALCAAGGVTPGDIQGALSAIYRTGAFSDVILDVLGRGPEHRAVLALREQPVVREISITGNQLISEAEVRSALAGQVGSPYNAVRTAEALERIIGRYREQGYLLVHVDALRMGSDGQTLEIVLSEGRVDGIRLEGQKHTRPSFVQREIRTAEGRPLNFTTLEDDIEHLYGMNIFETVNIGIEESSQGGAIVTLRLREKPRGNVRLGLRYDLEDSFTGLAEVAVENIGGRGIRFFVNALFGNYTDLAAGYHSPEILNTYFVHSLQAFYRDRTYALYDGNQNRTGTIEVGRTGVDFSFGYQWLKFGDTYLRYRYERDRTTESAGAAGPVVTSSIGSLAFLTTIDTRDGAVFPHRGILFTGSYEAASGAYGGNSDFRKLALYGQAALPLAERHTLTVDLITGFGSGSLPYQEQFGIGGVDHLLGYPLPGYFRREFVGSDALGGSVAYRWRFADYQLNALRALYLNVSAAAANVWNSRSDLSAGDLRGGAGIGLHADTIVGPVKLDFGAGEDRRYVVYFSAGFDF